MATTFMTLGQFEDRFVILTNVRRPYLDVLDRETASVVHSQKMVDNDREKTVKEIYFQMNVVQYDNANEKEEVLYARDVLTRMEYLILLEHLADDEFYAIEEDREHENGHLSNNLAIESAVNILATEPIKELLGYDLWHVLGYKDELEYIVDKLENAVK